MIQSDARLRRIEEATDLPLLLLALVMVPILLVPFLFDPSDGVRRSLFALDWMIWAIFAIEFGAKVAVAPRRLYYVRTHWLELGMVALPFLRPLRAARLFRTLRLGRVGVALGEMLAALRQLFLRRTVELTVAAVLAVGVVGAFAVLLAERHADGSNIHTFGDAVWWSVSTMTTVGYGDRFPTTPIGRVLAVALMVTGVSAMAAVTASIAAFFVRESGTRGTATLDDVQAELRALRSELAAMRGELDRPTRS